MASAITQAVVAALTTTATTSALPKSTGPIAPPQAGVLEGANPIKYVASNPITLFIIQAVIVILFCQLLHYPLRLVQQPRVIAEVIGGVLLGPSVMMRIPGFKDNIFPQESMPVFNNVANLGLIIFLFLVALEVDIRLFTSNWRAALCVGLAGMILPFGLGCAIAYGLYHQFRTESGLADISFGVYALFIGTALAITAFPVLCRILTELKLLRSGVGVTVLAAGVGNDVTGWILLALCVALVNSSSGLAALWALLCAVGWTLLLVFAVKPVFLWALRRTGSLQNGPTQGMVAVTLLMVLISAWFTGIIGIHPIFGAFLVGLICPHDGGFAIKLTEKIEDLLSVLFLPLYFALSGLSTNLGLLDDGITWAYVVGVIAVAFCGKIVGGMLAARFCGLLWRESAAIGVLMSCKGLVELIVLNVGLQAKILSQKTFTMFVVMALVTTVSTTPLTKRLYPPWYQQKVEKWRRGEIDWDGNPTSPASSLSTGPSLDKLQGFEIRRLVVYLRLDSLPSLFTFITLLGGDPSAKTEGAPASAAAKEGEAAGADEARRRRKRPLEIYGLRMIELTDRTSSVMHVTEGETYYTVHDPVVNAFRTFSQLNDVAVAGRVSVVPVSSYAETLMTQAADVASDFVLVPWSEYGSVTEDQLALAAPYAALPGASERFGNAAHLDFVQGALRQAVRTCTAGVLINNGLGGVVRPSSERPNLSRSRSGISIRSIHHRDEPPRLPVADKSHHVFFPFFGGVDDRVALRFVLQLARSPLVTVTIAHLSWGEAAGGSGSTTTTTAATTTAPEMVGGGGGGDSLSVVKSRVAAEEEEVSAHDLGLLSLLRSSLPAEMAGRVSFREVGVATAGQASQRAVELAQEVVGQTPKNAGDVVVLGRRHRRLGDVAIEDAGGDLGRVLGVVAEQMVAKGVKASVLVIQAGGKALNM